MNGKQSSYLDTSLKYLEQNSNYPKLLFVCFHGIVKIIFDRVGQFVTDTPEIRVSGRKCHKNYPGDFSNRELFQGGGTLLLNPYGTCYTVHRETCYTVHSRNVLQNLWRDHHAQSTVGTC